MWLGGGNDYDGANFALALLIKLHNVKLYEDMLHFSNSEMILVFICIKFTCFSSLFLSSRCVANKHSIYTYRHLHRHALHVNGLLTRIGYSIFPFSDPFSLRFYAHSNFA